MNSWLHGHCFELQMVVMCFGCLILAGILALIHAVKTAKRDPNDHQ